MTARAVLASLSLVAAFACDREGQAGPEPRPDPSAAASPASAGPRTEPEPPAPTPEPAQTQDPAPPREPVAVTPIPGADQPGPVYLVVSTQGLLRFDDGGVRRIAGKLDRHVQDLFVGPDGRVYLVDAARLATIEGDRLVELERFGYDTVAPVEALAVAPDGNLWVVGGRGAGPRVAGRWQLDSLEALGLGYSAEIVVGHDQTAWLIGGRKLLRRPAGAETWATVELDALGRAPLLLHPSASPSGAVLATDGQRLIRLTTEAEAPELTALVGSATGPDAGEGAGQGSTRAYTAGLAIAGDGTLAVASGDCRLLRFAPDGRGQPWQFPSPGPGAGAYACQTLEAMTVDASGRVWVAAREGLSVIGPGEEPGLALVEYPAGSFAGLAGRVSHMLAVGLGPASLPPAPEPARADLIGTALVDDQFLANATIEACPSVALVSDGSPCSRAKVRHISKTDARGRFRLADLAIGDYSFAVEVAGQWRWSSPPSFAAELRADETHELGSLEFTPL